MTDMTKLGLCLGVESVMRMSIPASCLLAFRRVTAVA